jgi:GntR family transcriptional regulator of arabinose operon
LDLLVSEGIISKRWGSGNTVISKSNSSKKNTVMILLPHIKSANTIVEDITSTLIKEGYSVECHETLNHFSSEREYLSTMMSEIYSGLIIHPVLSALPNTNVDLMQLLLKRQTPILFMDAIPAGIYNGTLLSADNYGKGYQTARSFINSGHKRLGGIFLHDSASSIATFSGFIDAIRDAGLNICDTCFLWVNSIDVPSINKFLKATCETADIIYVDDDRITIDKSIHAQKCDLQLSKPLGKEAAKKFIELKKNGNASSITIPYS